MSRGSVSPTWRKPAGVLFILVLAISWVVLAVSVIGALPWWAQLLLDVALGIVWILPLGPLLRWMETGKWR